MKKAKITTVIIAVLALTVLTGETLAQPGRGGRGGRQGWGPGMVDGPRRVQNFQPVQPDNSWVPGPYCPWVQGPNQNIQPRQGRGRGGFGQYFQRPRGPYCPLGQGPNQNIQGRQNREPGRFNRDFQGRGPGGFNQGFQGRGQGFGRRDMMMQRGGDNQVPEAETNKVRECGRDGLHQKIGIRLYCPEAEVGHREQDKAGDKAVLRVGDKAGGRIRNLK